MYSPKILSIVVTYNRLNLLTRCIDHLKGQSYLNNNILIINNSSTDNTENYLIEKNIPFLTQPNGGSSAGWHTGIAKAIECNYDFVWMMDDDGYPDKDALQILVKNIENDTVALSSLVVKEDKTNELVFGLPVFNKNGLPVIFAKKRKYIFLEELQKFGNSYPTIHPFNGTLINVAHTKKIGNVDLSYFMFGDEVDYYFRLRKAGKVKTIFNAIQYHPDVSKRTIDEKKVYYFIRNTIIINHLYFDKPYVRDFLTIGVALYRILKRNGLKVFFSYIIGNNSKYFYPAIIDGFKRNKTNRYQ